ncbi:hypothetical protein N9N08_00225 [bacterium]|jgi:hypothetical protein|nr:hypothetical protein [bacterium]
MTEYVDFYEKVESMDETELNNQLTTLYKKMSTIQSEGGMRLQIQGMIDLVKDRYQAIQMLKIIEKDKTPDIIEIGSVEEVVSTPDYSKGEILTHFSSFYSGDKVSKKNKIEKPVTGSARTTPPIITPADRPIQTDGIGDVPVFGSKK